MNEINLQAIPNQKLSVNVDNILYEITIKETNGVMSATVVRNGETLLSNNRLVGGTPLIPYKYMQDGNFIITTNNDEIPFYDQFGLTQFLIYASAEELEALSG